MTPRKSRTKHWRDNSVIKTISGIAGIMLFIFAIPPVISALTDKSPKTKTVHVNFINSELGVFEVKVCNESTNPINWEVGIDDYYTTLQLREESTLKDISIHINYPINNTAGSPDCISFTGNLMGVFYGTGIFYTECNSKGINICSLNWKDPGKVTYRKKFEYIIVDASAQSYDDAKKGERYDSINPKILDNILGDILFTQAPGREIKIRDGLYQNPQKRTIICGSLTVDEKFFYKKIIRENFPQYINEPLFCSREELLTPIDDDLRAFLSYIGDCDEQTEKRGRICTPTSSLYTRRIHENNPDSIVIFFPAITEELKMKE